MGDKVRIKQGQHKDKIAILYVIRNSVGFVRLPTNEGTVISLLALEPSYLGTATLRNTRNNGFRFNLVGKNGEIIATSEVYTTKAKAKQTLKLFPDFELIDKTK